jgi:hypothetical protein
VSLIGGVFLMQVFGFTLNLLTLLAIVLSVGLVVDDAIVMVENVERHLREGRAPFQAWKSLPPDRPPSQTGAIFPSNSSMPQRTSPRGCWNLRRNASPSSRWSLRPRLSAPTNFVFHWCHRFSG